MINSSFRSLLSKNAAPVYNLINEMFSIIAKFESRLLSQNWESEKESGFVQHPLFGMLKEGHRAFKCGAGFLFSGIDDFHHVCLGWLMNFRHRNELLSAFIEMVISK